MVRESGQEGLTLRRLAERAAVTPPALYHHFRDKNDLLCALAEEGFLGLIAATEGAPEVEGGLDARIRAFVRGYVAFAEANPETYELMFGRTLWKAGRPTASMKTRAHATFRAFLERVEVAVKASGVPSDTPILRIAQATWAMLHGLCRQRIDGIYPAGTELDAMADEVVRFFLARLGIRAGEAATPRPRAAEATITRSRAPRRPRTPRP